MLTQSPRKYNEPQEVKNAEIIDATSNINVALGANRQLQGLGAHWELWMLAQGGMSPMQALRCNDDERDRESGKEEREVLVGVKLVWMNNE